MGVLLILGGDFLTAGRKLLGRNERLVPFVPFVIKFSVLIGANTQVRPYCVPFALFVASSLFFHPPLRAIKIISR